MTKGADRTSLHGRRRRHGGLRGAPRRASVPYGEADRAEVTAAIGDYINGALVREERAALDGIMGRYRAGERELPLGLDEFLGWAGLLWFWLDFRLDDGTRVVDRLLADPGDLLRPAARAYLQALEPTSMRYYEITDVVPGGFIELTDLVEGDTVRVAEPSISTRVSRHELLAARVVHRGCSGLPELERGTVPIPSACRDGLLASLRERRASAVRGEHPGEIVAFYKQCVPLFVETCLDAIFGGEVTLWRDREGELVLPTSVSFAVVDHAALLEALRLGRPWGIAPREGGGWLWRQSTAWDMERSHGDLTISRGVLTVQVMSARCGERIRQVLDRLAGSALRYRATVHEDLGRKLGGRLPTSMSLALAEEDFVRFER